MADNDDKEDEIEILEEICEYLANIVCEDLLSQEVEPIPETVPDERVRVVS